MADHAEHAESGKPDKSTHNRQHRDVCSPQLSLWFAIWQVESREALVQAQNWPVRFDTDDPR